MSGREGRCHIYRSISGTWCHYIRTLTGAPRLSPSSYAKAGYPCPTLTTTRRRNWSHRNAQSFLEERRVHRVSRISRLSMEASHLPKGLCILIATRTTDFCTWRGLSFFLQIPSSQPLTNCRRCDRIFVRIERRS
jgi:hypothetical protein